MKIPFTVEAKMCNKIFEKPAKRNETKDFNTSHKQFNLNEFHWDNIASPFDGNSPERKRFDERFISFPKFFFLFQPDDSETVL